MSDSLPHHPDRWVGIHERLRTPALVEALEQAGLREGEHFTWTSAVSSNDVAPLLASHLSRTLHRFVARVKEDARTREDWNDQIARLAEELSAAQSLRPGTGFEEVLRDLPVHPLRQLLEVRPQEAVVVGGASLARPDLPLGVSALLTGSSRSPSLLSQIEKEMASADQVDWLVSFIKWSGIRPLRDALRRFAEATPASSDGVSETGPRLRIATTSYLGATDLKAIEFLSGLPNTEVRVSYDTHRTRLHAKAYLFHRDTGFGNAYVGSANLSRAALDEGLEWTAKISEYELPWLWRQLEAAFDSHWEDAEEFEPLHPGELDRLARALEAERTGKDGSASVSDAGGPYFDLHPYAFQKEILDSIAAERRNGIHKHLVVAATGTGKTMVAAFDYRAVIQASREEALRLGMPLPPRPSLLFLAHREEILKQSLATFRQVLRDREFGDLLVGGSTPGQGRYLFCSVQSWKRRELGSLPPDHFDYVVLDEAHHAAADTYQEILSHLRPEALLGLTATPERADGLDIRQDFASGPLETSGTSGLAAGAGEEGSTPHRPGGFTHELRLPDAVERRLLSPFHYFGVADAPGVDLSHLSWERGGYRHADLEGVFTGNDARARWVRDQFLDLSADAARARGLGFCVSQAHARFMAQRFTEWGIPSVALTAAIPPEERHTAQRRLVTHEIRFIFTVDLYNEGIDIPEVDTVLLLRPTESLTVYLQQLGRGLRLHPEKSHLTVLDFIAPQNRNFRFADRFRALTLDPSQRIDHQIEARFPWLPSGCLVHLDARATEVVLDNIRQSVGQRRPQIISRLHGLVARSTNRPGLQQVLDWLHMDEPDELLRLTKGLPSLLLSAAGWPMELGAVESFEPALRRGLRSLAFADDPRILEALERSLATPASGETVGPVPDGHLVLALSLLWGTNRAGDGSPEDALSFVLKHPELRQDVLDVVRMRRRGLRTLATPFQIGGNRLLHLHARYSRDQVRIALGHATFQNPGTHREGVLHLPDQKVDAFFVTVRKSDSRFSPTTMYEDYALTDRLFHWQSQSTTSPSSPTGQRYIQHTRMGYTPLLFVREAAETVKGLTEPFWFLGPLEYIRHHGGRPMSITWRLQQPIPAIVLRWAREAA